MCGGAWNGLWRGETRGIALRMAGPELREHARPRGRHGCVSCRRAAAIALLVRGGRERGLLAGGAGLGGCRASQRGHEPKHTMTGWRKACRGADSKSC
jgi:hypothetical protein